MKSAVDSAKEKWIRRVALEGEEAVRDGIRQDGNALRSSKHCTKDVNL